jgi:4-hydroxy-tetrahydrodipicolinate synthase
MTIERVRQALRGISGVHVTPYEAGGSIDVPLMADIVERIARAGVHNIVSTRRRCAPRKAGRS